MKRLLLVLLLACVPAGSLPATGSLQRAVPAKGSLPGLQTTAPTGRIVVKFHEASGLAVAADGLVAERAAAGARVRALLDAAAPGVRLERRFRRPAAELDRERRAAEARSGRRLPDLNRYGQLDLGPDAPRDLLVETVRRLAADPAVETAFLEPVAVPAALGFDAFTGETPAPTPAAGAEPAATPDFSGMQGYRGPAPDGVGATVVAGTPGADGATVRVIDVEGAWLWTHEDLPASFVEIGTQIDDLGWRNHGTAVLGEIRGIDNGYGVVGIAPATDVGASSIGSQSTASAINSAATTLSPGDIILIELHAPGPNANGSGQFGYVAMEFWQDNFDAIQLATALGVIVCEAAGNGQQDYDDPVYQGLFDRDVRDSGAIMCGASASGSLDPAWFTNHGERVDLHGWGGSVTTCGYGGLQGDPAPETEWYTSSFSGTSSASPIVVGAVASLQGMVRSAYGLPLDAQLARHVLVQTGTPQNPDPWLIGPRPDLAAAWTLVSASGVGEVAGTVTDAGTAAPVADVLVDLVGAVGFTRTGPDGGYRFPLLAGGHDLAFSSFFYESVTLPVTVASGATTTLDVALVPQATSDLVGTVYAPDGTRLAGVDVTPLAVPVAGTVTGALGEFTLADAPQGHVYELLFEGLPGHGAAWRSVDASAPALPEIPVLAVLPPVDHDFEAGADGFTADAVWTWGTPAAGGPAPAGFGGTGCWGVGMTGDYLDDALGHLTSPVVDFTAETGDMLHLSFHYWCDTEPGFDGVKLQVLTGGAWETRTPLSGYTDRILSGLGSEPGWSGDSGGWRGAVFDLEEFLGGTLQFRLVFGSDGYVTGPGFWVDEIAYDTGYAVTAVGGPTPDRRQVALSAYPNPFNPATTIAWRIAVPGRLRIAVYDLQGRLVRTLRDGPAPGLSGQERWDGRDARGRTLASGVYLVHMEGPQGAVARRTVVMTK